ncbi:proline-rich proteoglycan 2-like [Cervus canadensis]|uniref:proline-rich proteoglycan 2-like n=1 Tax=Cervus canadensis TaxID=1574408 RepID=UPI001C9E5B02|nr:proline-rich proteoglycan 2-like [Cervus canadensis]
MVRSSAPGPGRRSGPGPRHLPRGSRNVRMVTRGLGPPRSSPDGRAPSPPPRRSGRTRVPRPFGGQSWGAPLRAPTPGRLPRLLTHRPRARGSQGRPLPPCGRSPRGPGPHTPLQSGRGLRAGRAVEPGRLGLGQGSRARRETPGASHEAFLPSGSQTQAPWAVQLPPPGLSWRRRLRSLGTEQSPGKRSLSSSSRRAARQGEAESPAPGAGCPGCGAATTAPGNTVQSLPALQPRNPSLMSKRPPNFAQLDVALRSQVLEAESR